jgi:hypothetical protein
MVMTNSTKTKVEEFAKNIIIAKASEQHHIMDNNAEQKRWLTGIGGELALEKYLNTPFFDWSIGNSEKYNVPDLKRIGLNVGVKTVEYGKFPVVHINPKRPEVIVVRSNNKFYICGLATVENLKNNSSIDLIIDKKLRERKVKTGFYGFSELISFNNIKELREIAKAS